MEMMVSFSVYYISSEYSQIMSAEIIEMKQHNRAKITWAIVREIRRELAKNLHRPKYRELAARFGISTSAIHKIATGQSWVLQNEDTGHQGSGAHARFASHHE